MRCQWITEGHSISREFNWGWLDLFPNQPTSQPWDDLKCVRLPPLNRQCLVILRGCRSSGVECEQRVGEMQIRHS